MVYADAAARHSREVIKHVNLRTDIPAWNAEGTTHPEEMVLITQSLREVNQIMGTYVGIVRSNLRLDRAWNRLDILYEETERLFTFHQKLHRVIPAASKINRSLQSDQLHTILFYRCIRPEMRKSGSRHDHNI